MACGKSDVDRVLAPLETSTGSVNTDDPLVCPGGDIDIRQHVPQILGRTRHLGTVLQTRKKARLGLVNSAE